MSPGLFPRLREIIKLSEDFSVFLLFFFKGFASNVFKKLIPLFKQAGEPQ